MKVPKWIKIILRLFILILPILFLIPSVLYVFDNTLVLFPNSYYSNLIQANVTENSTLSDFRLDPEKITLSFIFRAKPRGELYPYCSMIIWLKMENSYFDLSGFDYLAVEFDEATQATPETVVVFIKTFLPGVSNPDKNDGYTQRHNEYTVSFLPDVSRYTIKIKDFLTYDWWFELLNVPEDKRKKETFKKVSALDFQFIHRGTDPPDEKKQKVIFTGISLHKSYPVFYIVLDILAGLSGFFLIFGVIKKKKILEFHKEYPESPLKILDFKRLELENYADNELARIMQYIKAHYDNPEITSRLISREIGITRAHVTKLIKKQYGLTCRQIINQIRITEAKRLLKETDRYILEIALTVGFNDISTFNRCFKQADGMTPGQYRSTMQPKNTDQYTK